MGCFTGRAGAFFGDIALRAAADGLNRFSVFPGIVFIEILPIPVLEVIDNLRELIHLEFLILGGMGIVKGPLFERDISADEMSK